MNDPYANVFDEIAKALTVHGNMVLWLAERTLSLKDYKEFIDEFTKKEDNRDELIEFLYKKGRRRGNELAK